MPGSLERAALTRLERRLDGRVLVLGSTPLELAATAVRVDAPVDEAALHAIHGEHDAAVIGGWGRGLTPARVARRARELVREGGVVAFVVPTLRSGWRRAQGALLGAFRRQSPVLFEELCEAMLRARLADVTGAELSGSRGLGVVTARVVSLAPGLDAAESSVRTIASLREPSQKIGS